MYFDIYDGIHQPLASTKIYSHKQLEEEKNTSVYE